MVHKGAEHAKNKSNDEKVNKEMKPIYRLTGWNNQLNTEVISNNPSTWVLERYVDTEFEIQHKHNLLIETEIRNLQYQQRIINSQQEEKNNIVRQNKKYSKEDFMLELTKFFISYFDVYKFYDFVMTANNGAYNAMAPWNNPTNCAFILIRSWFESNLISKEFFKVLQNYVPFRKEEINELESIYNSRIN